MTTVITSIVFMLYVCRYVGVYIVYAVMHYIQQKYHKPLPYDMGYTSAAMSASFRDNLAGGPSKRARRGKR